MVTVFRGLPTNLQLLKASRKKQLPGDVFSQSRRGRDAYSNKGFLRNAPNETARQRVIDGRVWHPQHEIDTFRSHIDKIWGAGC